MGMLKVLAVGVIVFVLSYLPLYWLAENAPELSEEDIHCGMYGAAIMIDNPIEQLVTRLAISTHKEGDVVFISAYTFFGIPISKFKTNCATGDAEKL
jgi:hypothetical protein